jgi:hypothetical protein
VNDWRQPPPEVSGHAEVVAVDGQADPGRVAQHQAQAAPGLEGAALRWARVPSKATRPSA